MRVYKFLYCKYGLRALRQRRLKISEVRSLNDPFDLLPFDLSDPELRKGVIASRNEIGQGRGLLCFSRYWHNPVLWEHYADSHKGLCLGFELPNNGEAGQRVEYVENPIKLNYLNMRTANRILFTKYAHWQYEDEIRVWASLDEKSDDHYFKEFDDDLRLQEVIVGPGTRFQNAGYFRLLEGVKLVKARLAFDAFKVVQDESGLSAG